MKTSSLPVLVVRLLVLAVIFFAVFAGGGALLGPKTPALPPEQEAAWLAGLLLLAGVDTLVVALIILRARWGGVKLMLAVGFALYGVMTFMAAIEAVWFGGSLGITSDMVPGLFLQTVPLSVVFVPLAVLILGKARPPADAGAPNDRLAMPATEWAWKLAVLAVVYLVLYFGFGMLVAWQNPALRAVYSEGANQAVFAAERLVPLQLARGLLWVAFALPIVRLLRGGAWETAVIVGLLYALPMNMAHALPNPFMPDPSVRLSHFVETASSNFIFGVIVTGLLLWRRGKRG